MHAAQVRRRIDDHGRDGDFLPGRLVLLLLVDVLGGARGIIGARSGNAFRIRELMGVVPDGVVFFELAHAGALASEGALQVDFAEFAGAHGLDQRGGRVDGEEAPVVVGRACRGIGEGAPLLEGGDDVDEDGGADVVRGVVVDYEAVADASASVVAAPDYGACGAEDGLQGFHDEVSDGALVVLGGKGGEAVAWQLDHEEGDVRLPFLDEMSPPVVECQRLILMWLSPGWR